MLPTTGMNQAGVTRPTTISDREIHALTMATVSPNWPIAPIHHSTRATAGISSAPAVATSKTAMVIVDRNGIRIGCRASASAAAGRRAHFAAYKALSRTKTANCHPEEGLADPSGGYLGGGGSTPGQRKSTDPHGSGEQAHRQVCQPTISLPGMGGDDRPGGRCTVGAGHEREGHCESFSRVPGQLVAQAPVVRW